MPSVILCQYRTMCQQTTDLINIILHEGRFSARDLADAAEVSEGMIQQVASNPDKRLRSDKMAKLSRQLSKYGDNRLASLYLDPRYEIVLRGESIVNGIIDDEITDLTEYAGRAVHAFKTRNKNAGQVALDSIEEVRDRMQAEFNNL